MGKLIQKDKSIFRLYEENECSEYAKLANNLEQKLLNLFIISNSEKFSYVSCEIDKRGIVFNIATPYPNGLPEKVGELFFNLDMQYDVQCKEIEDLFDGKEKKFQIQIKNR